ncbi:MAG: hypothetical protein GY910_00860 [bacterium]|nr:hypothetical protein [bacterium]
MRLCHTLALSALGLALGCAPGPPPPAAYRNRLAARETAIARSLRVTIESLVRLVEEGSGGAGLETIVHQLSSASRRGARLETVWRSETGEVHALLSLDLDRIQRTVRSSRSLSPATREDLSRRAAEAFATLVAAFARKSAREGGEATRSVDEKISRNRRADCEKEQKSPCDPTRSISF